MEFRDRLEQSRLQPTLTAQDNAVEKQFLCPYFGIDKSGVACLELRLPDGGRKALPYSFFTELNFDPDKGIEIKTTHKCIHIAGRQLARLYEYLVAYRVRYVQTQLGMDAEIEEGIVVKEITIEEL